MLLSLYFSVSGLGMSRSYCIFFFFLDSSWIKGSVNRVLHWFTAVSPIYSDNVCCRWCFLNNGQHAQHALNKLIRILESRLFILIASLLYFFFSVFISFAQNGCWCLSLPEQGNQRAKMVSEELTWEYHSFFNIPCPSMSHFSIRTKG